LCPSILPSILSLFSVPHGYAVVDNGALLWSSGPDAEGETDDDIQRWLELDSPD